MSIYQRLEIVILAFILSRLSVLIQLYVDKQKAILQKEIDFLSTPKYASIATEGSTEARDAILAHQWRRQTEEERNEKWRKLKSYDRKDLWEFIFLSLVAMYILLFTDLLK